MENVSMCWIQEEASDKEVKPEDPSKPLTDLSKKDDISETIVPDTESPTTAGEKVKDSEVPSETSENGPTINRSAHTLVDINFKIKKGTL